MKMKKNVYGVPDSVLSTEKMLVKEAIMYISCDYFVDQTVYVYMFNDCMLIARPKKGAMKIFKSFKFNKAEVLYFSDLKLNIPKENETFAFNIRITKEPIIVPKKNIIFKRKILSV